MHTLRAVLLPLPNGFFRAEVTADITLRLLRHLQVGIKLSGPPEIDQ
jgi:hypothetical protein